MALLLTRSQKGYIDVYYNDIFGLIETFKNLQINTIYSKKYEQIELVTFKKHAEYNS